MPTQSFVPGLGQFPASISLSSLNGANGFQLYDLASDGDGVSVSAAGDVNDDGIADILMGAYGANAHTGKTYVVFGKASGWTSPISVNTLNGANGFVLDGLSLGDSSGNSVRAAGDVNNDGIADILIGAYAANTRAGKTYVVFGKSSAWSSSMSLGALNGANGFALDGVSTNEYSGVRVSTAGDVNNDGIADIIIGTYGFKTYIVFGKASGWSSSMSLSALNGANGFVLEVAASDVSTAGDVNNDGIADILIGASGFNSSAGRTYVVFGKASGWTSSISLDTLDGTNGFALDGVSANDGSGYSVRTAGDVNNDGIADILVGAYRANNYAGKTYVVFGKVGDWSSTASLGTLNGTNGFELSGVSANDWSGLSVSTAGDVNNDGIADIIIGAYAANSGAGKTYVVFGKTSGWTSPISLSTLNGANGFALDGVSANDGSGGSVSAAGDVNDDGIADIIIGKSGSYAGKAYVVFGDSPPVLENNSLTIGADCTITLDATYLAAYDLNHANNTLTFTASNITNGHFQKNASGVIMPLFPPIFSQSDITNGCIQFVSNSSNAPSYNIAVNSSGFAFVPATPAIVNFVTPCTEVPTQAPTFAPSVSPTFSPSVSPSASPTFSPTASPSVAPTFLPTVNPSAAPTTAPSFAPTFAPTATPTVMSTRVPSVAPSTRMPSASVISSAARTSPAWFLPVSQVVSLLDSTLPAAYESISGYLSGLDTSASNQPDTHNAAYASPSLQTVGAQLMLGAVVLKLAQKGINWAKGFWTSEPTLKPNAASALSEVAQSLQKKGSDSVSQSATQDLRADVKHLSEKMETYQACLEEAAAQTANVVYPDFQKPGINFAYNVGARKRTPDVAEQAAFANSAQLSSLGR